MRDITWTHRGPKASVALSTCLFAIGLSVVLGSATAAAATKGTPVTTVPATVPSTTTAPKSTTTTMAKAPTTTVAKTTTTTTTVKRANTTTTTAAAVPKATTTTVPKSTTTTAPKSTTTTPVAHAAATVAGTGTTSTTTAPKAGSAAAGARTRFAPGACGSSPVGPISDDQTITTTGSVLLTKPVVLKNCTGVTFNGGVWNDPNTSPGTVPGGAEGKGRPAFDIIGGSDITLENLSVVGVNRGGYSSDLAFNAGIETQGTAGLTLSGVRVAHVFGDCLTLNPLRSGTGRNNIVAVVRNLTVTGFNGTACGRQGISPVSVNGATLTDITIGTTAFASFDAEADQPAKEGAKNVTVNHCSFSDLIAVTAGGEATGPITFSNCTMKGSGSGDVLMVDNTSGGPDAGPITLSNDSLHCGASAYVSCFQLQGATDVVVQDTAVTIGYPDDALYESAYNLTANSHVVFANDVMTGFGHMGASSAGSTATVTGGSWVGRDCRAPALCPIR